MTNFHALYGDAVASASAESGIPLPTVEGVLQFLGPAAVLLMMLGAIAALVGYISSTGVIGRMPMSKEGTVLLAGLGTFILGFMAWLT